MNTTPIQINRECGSCTECCQGWLSCSTFGRPVHEGRPCHFVGTAGCTVYNQRPKDPCIDYKCEWLVDDGTHFPEWLKPSLSKVIITRRQWSKGSYIEVKECGQKIDSVILNYLYMYCAKNSISMHIQVAGGWHTLGPSELAEEINRK